jgi:transcriptional regulator with XRE-family HTH domain
MTTAIKREALKPVKKEFLQLAARSGWSQAELARQLELTRGGVHGIVKGKTSPSAGLLKLLKLVLAQEKPDVLTDNLLQRTRGSGQELLSELDHLPEHIRVDCVKHVSALVRLLAGKHKTGPRGVSSTPISLAGRAGAKAAAEFQRPKR